MPYLSLVFEIEQSYVFIATLFFLFLGGMQFRIVAIFSIKKVINSMILKF
jgi:hypothetical protein